MKAFSKWRSGIALLIVVFVACLAGCCFVPENENNNNTENGFEEDEILPDPN